MNVIFPLMHSGQMESIFYHYSASVTTLIIIDFFLSLIICLMNCFMFIRRHKPAQYNMIISDKSPFEAIREIIGCLFSVAILILVFTIVLADIISFFVISLLSAYFISGIGALCFSISIVNFVRLYWYFFKGKWRYLYLSVDKHGATVEFMVLNKRDRAAAKAFFRKAFRHSRMPYRINIDKSGTKKSFRSF